MNLIVSDHQPTRPTNQKLTAAHHATGDRILVPDTTDLFASSDMPKPQAKAIPDLKARREEILRLAHADKLPTIEPFPAQGMPGMVTNLNRAVLHAHQTGNMALLDACVAAWLGL